MGSKKGPKIVYRRFKLQYSKTKNLILRIAFHHETKTAFIRGLWIESVKYKIKSNQSEMEEFEVIGGIPDIPDFGKKPKDLKL